MADDVSKKDLNGDGKVTPAEEDYWKSVNPDPLSKKELAQKYGFALRVLKSDPELWSLFRRAVAGETAGDQWTADKFTVELQNSSWWRENNEYARRAWTAQQLGGADWKASVENAESVVQRRATSYGVALNKTQLRDLATRYLYEGWEDPRRIGFLDSALSDYLNKENSVGDVEFQTDLRTLAFNYGVKVDDSFIDKLQRQIMRGVLTAEQAEQQIIDKAKSKYAPIADKIDQGQTTREALSMYISSMSDLLELGGEDKVDLNDPLLKQAMSGEDGQMMSVWDFEKAARRDERWKNTKNGQMTYVSFAQEFMKQLGF